MTSVRWPNFLFGAKKWLFVHCSPVKVGKLVSVDDEDQAKVSFSADSAVYNSDRPDHSSQPESSPTVLILPLDRLCKVAMT